MFITWVTEFENGDMNPSNSYLIKRTITSDYDVKPIPSIGIFGAKSIIC